MQLSRLEEQKQKGNLNLDHLKRKSKVAPQTNSTPAIVVQSTMPVISFQKHTKALQPIDFAAKKQENSPNNSTQKATTLAMDPSYGFLP